MREREPIARLSELYNQFGREDTKFHLLGLPFIAVVLANAGALGFSIFTGNQTYLQYYSQQALIPEMAAGAITLLGGVVGYKREVKLMRSIIKSIAETEDREPSDLRTENRRARSIVALVTFLSQNRSVPDHGKPRSASVRSTISSIESFQVASLFKKFDRVSGWTREPAKRKDITETALEIVENFWIDVAKDPQRPDHKRRWAYQMLAEIRRRYNL